MAEATNLTNSSIALPGVRPEVFQEARQIRGRAAVAQRPDSPHLAKALARLDRLLASGRQPEINVPPGYFLNIRV